MGSIISTFHIDWRIIVAQLINFCIVLAVLYFFALKPLQKLMSERSEKIARGVSDAKQNAELLAATRAEYEAALQKARAEAETIFQEGKRQAEAKRMEMVEAAKKEVNVMLANGKKALETEKTRMVDDARKDVAALIVEASRKVLGGVADSTMDGKVAKEIEKLK
ncbi:F0F1 ATP synthase subunit B [Patescibacteria group bacterium]|nr:F0F1 ATP synthase subunit B [Patescibacteria group bacterium]